MNTSSTHTPEKSERHPRAKAAGKALVWLLVVVLTIGPFPWW
jgi:hypothetical protein